MRRITPALLVLSLMGCGSGDSKHVGNIQQLDLTQEERAAQEKLKQEEKLRQEQQRASAEARRQQAEEAERQRRIALEEQRRREAEAAERERAKLAEEERLRRERDRKLAEDERIREEERLAEQQRKDQIARLERQGTINECRARRSELVKQNEEDTERLALSEKNVRVLRIKLAFAQKEAARLQQDARRLTLNEQQFGGAGTTVVVSNRDLIQKAQEKSDAAVKEGDAAARQLRDAETMMKTSQDHLQQRASDIALIDRRLAELGAAPAAPVAKRPALVSAPTNILVLKDGTRIEAFSMVTAADTYVIKDENGKFITIERANVLRVESPP